MRYFMKFSYDGSKFSGYQKQPDRFTVQEDIEKALKQINNGKSVSIFSSGRTDAGVHAYNQTSHFDLDINITEEKLRKAINSLTSDSIYIKSISIIDNDFHARFDVQSKEYIYKINIGLYNPIEKDYVYQYNKNLNFIEMEKALKKIEGVHDFRSFVKIDKEKKDYIRNIFQTSIKWDVKDDNILIISIRGNGFMRYMVRNIVGMIIEIGEGKYNSEDIIKILNSRDRKQAGKCAPACGLYLKDVYY